MKKSLKLAVAAATMAMPVASNAATLNNMENPLFLPSQQTFYSKLSNGVMLKVADSSYAHKAKNHDGKVEFPIIRIQEEMGYGITDRLAVRGSVQYTHDDDIGRTGLSAGRLGLIYRLLNQYHGFVWDVYGDLHLGGLGEMRGQYNISGAPVDLSDAQTRTALGTQAGKLLMAAGKNPQSEENAALLQATVSKLAAAQSLGNASGVIDYDNYSNGMWGYHFGTKFGYVWNNKLTTSAFVEVLRTIGDDNSRIRLVGSNNVAVTSPDGSKNSTALLMAAAGAPSEITAEFKSTTEVNAGANVFYQWTPKWSTGAWFRYEHHADQGIKKITTAVSKDLEAVKAALEQKLSNLNDGFDAYVIGLSAAHQFTERAQVTLYGEYTFDTAHPRSQNGTDAKAELGARVNFMF